MFNPFRFFATGKDLPEIQDKNVVDNMYKKYRLKVMLAITVGYGLAYPLRLALNVVKKPLIDNGIFTAMGFIGVFSYIGAGLQDQISGFLIDSNSTAIDGVLTYNFNPVIIYWIGSSIISMILAATLWRVKVRD